MRKVDLVLLVVTVLLTLFGLLMVYDASSYIAFRDFGDKYHYIKDQLMWVVIGFLGLFFFSFFNYRSLFNLSLPIMLFGIVLLLFVFVPGIGVVALGARRWIDLRLFTIQPAEFIKLGLAIYLAAWFSQKEKGRLLAFLLLLGVVGGLVLLEPDMGTATIIFSEALLVYFLSGANLLHFFLIAPAVFVLGFFLITLEPYRAARLYAFLRLSKSVEFSSYHIKQILIALGVGGVSGVGLGQSIQKYAYLPENTTDSIFAVIAEELGFVGATIVVVFLAVVVWRGILIASRAKDAFGKLLAGGITSFLAVQMILNLGSQTALLPLTGIPLPFISYGGSSLIVALCAVGILLNIAKQSV